MSRQHSPQKHARMKMNQTQAETGWTNEEEATIARIMADETCGKMEAIRRMRRRAEPRVVISIPKTNVSKQADAEFMRLLEIEDPGRHRRLMANIRKDSPNAGMTEAQALTNFMLGLPTGNLRFEVIAGRPAPQPIALIVKKPRVGRPVKHKTLAARRQARVAYQRRFRTKQRLAACSK
jgi:hypothetical protein